MLAVKLHAKKQPPLSAGTYLIPILDWQTGQIHIRRWLKHINSHNTGRKPKKVRYITLVTIPDHHQVALYLSSSIQTFSSDHNFLRLDQVAQGDLAELKKWYGKLAHSSAAEHSTANLPELVIGEPLPKSCIKWTKRIELLYGREANTKTRKHRR